jgi:CheY-like chemotaxis protein
MFGVSMEERGVVAKVLAVDDTPANLMALAAILEPLEVEVVTATGGAQALEPGSRDEFAAILLDVMMPGMDGFETLAKLRTIPSTEATPVVLVTAHEFDADAVERVQGLGIVDYILKPIQAVLLRSKVAALVLFSGEARRFIGVMSRSPPRIGTSRCSLTISRVR